MMYCQKCGSENKNGANFCLSCGANLSSTNSKKNRINPKLIGGLIVAVVAVLIIIVAFTGCGGSKHDERLIGKWCAYSEGENTDIKYCITYNEDGTRDVDLRFISKETGEDLFGDNVYSGVRDYTETWSTNGSKLYLVSTCDDGSNCLTDYESNEKVSQVTITALYKIKDNHLIMTYTEGSSGEYEKEE